MGLDVSLTIPRTELPRARLAASLLRENGFEDFAQEIECCHDARAVETVFEANYTHDCGEMAKSAGIYDAVWRPDENGITKASQLIPILKSGISAMELDPPKFEAMNPCNGWGSYKTFLPLVRGYLNACIENPTADVSAWR